MLYSTLRYRFATAYLFATHIFVEVLDKSCEYSLCEDDFETFLSLIACDRCHFACTDQHVSRHNLVVFSWYVKRHKIQVRGWWYCYVCYTQVSLALQTNLCLRLEFVRCMAVPRDTQGYIMYDGCCGKWVQSTNDSNLYARGTRIHDESVAEPQQKKNKTKSVGT